MKAVKRWFRRPDLASRVGNSIGMAVALLVLSLILKWDLSAVWPYAAGGFVGWGYGRDDGIRRFRKLALERIRSGSPSALPYAEAVLRERES